MLPIPLWGEIVVWIWVGGMVVSLPFWFSFAYRTDGRDLHPFIQYMLNADFIDHAVVALFTIVWFLVWPFLIMIEAISDKPFLLHFVKVGLGNQGSLRWYLDHFT